MASQEIGKIYITPIEIKKKIRFLLNKFKIIIIMLYLTNYYGMQIRSLAVLYKHFSLRMFVIIRIYLYM